MGRTNIRERIDQVRQWCEMFSPPGRPVEVRWLARVVDDDGEECEALTYKHGRGFRIDLSLARLGRHRRFAIDTFLHEWAHTTTWLDHQEDEHPPAMWIEYGRLYCAWNEDGGDADSTGFETKRRRVR